MPEYVVLIYGDEAAIAAGGQPLFQELLEGHQKFGVNNASAIRGSRALQPTATATSMRTDPDGTVHLSDGPFVTGVDALSGYYVIEGKDIAAAAEIAAQIPAAHGGVEIRPVMTFG